MYESLAGTLLSKGPMHAVLEAAGLGYRIETSLRTSERLPARSGQSAKLLLHLEVREDAWRLFGFHDEEERGLFRRLMKVSGIGPSHALGLLSAHGPSDLWRLLAARDAKALAKTKGIGKRLAERLGTELHEEAQAMAGPVSGSLPTSDTAPAPAPPAHDGVLGEVIDALLVLGYGEAEAERAARRALEEQGTDASAGELVRSALQRI